MTLRLHLTAQDLARIRLAEGARPLLELSIGIRLLQERTYPVRFDAWRQRAAQHLRPRLSPLFDLIPALGPSVDFLDMSGAESLETSLEQMRSMPARRVVRDLEQWADGREDLPRSARQLRDDPSLVRHVAQAVRDAHQGFIAPYWPRIEQVASADRTARIQQLADDGVERLLRELNPRYITWESPVLHVTTASGRDDDVRLEGRGLLLIPSVFGAHYPAYDHPDDGQPWITFPVRDSAHAAAATAGSTARTLTDAPASLRALLGRTRAVVLLVIAEHPACTTSQLAAHARISPASASEHATVLRNAGLTTLTRQGKRVLHALSPAGQALLTSTAKA
ncbi:ArsR/SmtB family transcription factor [Streptomyces youssoufiensis]